eukprot:gnl/MRDRNA2_/MRDRNA2_86639_c0_seq2.p1 gnl/MRDRNA2_/MRDRNA2_86639_c0~~gnl/MRDRNA2_/MRDRNA2_86639_c0_seq2.p1  ORF type:complete len:485 (+),score=27.31 gnl/MRDRNA2_/MRDRNA2_86639_c0_seq2:52-1506(+)
MSNSIYVGKIAPTVTDDLLVALFQICGDVKSWKAIIDPETKKRKDFGYVDFESIDAVLKALRFLNGLKVKGSFLLLKVNKATQNILNEYLMKKAPYVSCQKQLATIGKKTHEFSEAIEIKQKIHLELKKHPPMGKKNITDEFLRKHQLPVEHKSEEAHSLQHLPKTSQRVHGGSEKHKELNLKTIEDSICLHQDYLTRLRVWKRYETKRNSWRLRAKKQRQIHHSERQKMIEQDNNDLNCNNENETWNRTVKQAKTKRCVHYISIINEDKKDYELKQVINNKKQTSIMKLNMYKNVLFAKKENFRSSLRLKTNLLAFSTPSKSTYFEITNIEPKTHPNIVLCAISEPNMTDIYDTQISKSTFDARKLTASGTCETYEENTISHKNKLSTIPKTWDELKGYAINWYSFEKRKNTECIGMQVWISIKVAEKLGKETTMASYLYHKICQHTSAQTLATKIYEVLGDETLSFVLNLYRMVIYEAVKKH